MFVGFRELNNLLTRYESNPFCISSINALRQFSFHRVQFSSAGSEAHANENGGGQFGEIHLPPLTLRQHSFDRMLSIKQRCPRGRREDTCG